MESKKIEVEARPIIDTDLLVVIIRAKRNRGTLPFWRLGLLYFVGWAELGQLISRLANNSLGGIHENNGRFRRRTFWSSRAKLA